MANGQSGDVEQTFQDSGRLANMEHVLFLTESNCNE